MKRYFLISILLTIISCKNSNNRFEVEEKAHMKLHEEMDKVDKEYSKFENQLSKLYGESENDAEKVLKKVDSLLLANKNEKDKYKSQIKSDIDRSLHSFKAELFYHLGNYKESISELNFEESKTGSTAIAYAANYVKLKDFKKAKSFIDSIGNCNGNYYALGNYYESVGDKTSALKTYKENLEDDKSRKHFIYYIWTQKRVEELEKNKPLLNEVFFPTENPNFEICEICNVDNAKREKIMNLLAEIPENQKDWSGTAILESPYDTGKDYYWVRVTVGNREINYYVYPKNYGIKYFDPKTKTVKTVEEWRKKNKKGL